MRARFLCIVVALMALAAGVRTGQQPSTSFQDLLTLADEVAALRRSTGGGPVDFSPATISRQQGDLARLKTRLAAIDPASWSVSDRIDHILVGAQLAELDFTYRVVVPWERDPGHYVDLIRRVPYTATPVPADRRDAVLRSLRSVPVTLDEARRRLTRPSAELARMAIFALERSDEVNQGEPRRPRPPAGVIGWFEDLAARLPAADGELTAATRAALEATRAFRDWLKAALPTMREPAWLGLDNYNWYLRHVRLVPLTFAQVRLIGDRELARGKTLLAIERQRNAGLPELAPATTAEDHERRTREAEQLIRSVIASKRLMTIPDYIPATFETDAFFIDRSAWGGHRHFWDEITYRDPLNNHIHASIPGHRFDQLIQRRNPRPIRRTFSDGTRAEAWGFYVEEMLLQAGLLDQRPRTRELFYIAQLKRAARIPAELRMQTGEISLQQAIDYLIEQVPLMEEHLARYDLGIYLRRPAYGMNYIVGKAQLEALVADRAQQLGAGFDLGRFHDAFLAAGSIPVSLIRWEMTGLDNEVRALGLVR
jgi:uncharacterized protein (DUF885 family)